MDNIKQESIELIKNIKECHENLLNITIEDEKKGIFAWNVDKENLKKRIEIYQFIIELLEE